MSNSEDDFRKFQRVTNAHERHSLLAEAERTYASVMIWTKGQERNIDTRILKLVPPDIPSRENYPPGSHLYCWIPSGFNAQDFAAYLEQILAPDCFFSLSLARANVFFKARFLESDPVGLKFEIPDELYKVQRREDQRHQIPDGHVLKIHFADPQLKDQKQNRRVVDLSAGGLSFLIDDAESSAFVSGMVLKELSFSVKGRPIKAEGEVRHKRPTPPHLVNTLLAGTRVGVQFAKITEGDRQWIRAWVLEETRKLVAKFLG